MREVEDEEDERSTEPCAPEVKGPCATGGLLREALSSGVVEDMGCCCACAWGPGEAARARCRFGRGSFGRLWVMAGDEDEVGE